MEPDGPVFSGEGLDLRSRLCRQQRNTSLAILERESAACSGSLGNPGGAAAESGIRRCGIYGFRREQLLQLVPDAPRKTLRQRIEPAAFVYLRPRAGQCGRMERSKRIALPPGCL